MRPPWIVEVAPNSRRETSLKTASANASCHPVQDLLRCPVCVLPCGRRLAHSRRLPSARNDAVANVAIVAAELVMAVLWQSPWPDLVVGLGIAALNADAARDVWQAARGNVAARRPEA